MNKLAGTENTCHGCDGKGWVSPNPTSAVKCPVCNGTGTVGLKGNEPQYVINVNGCSCSPSGLRKIADVVSRSFLQPRGINQ